MHDDVLRKHAQEAGIETDWQDVMGRKNVVSVDVLRAVLSALGGIEAAAETCRHNAKLMTTEVGQAIVLAGSSGAYRLIHEDGTVHGGIAETASTGHIRLPPIDVPGYYQLNIGDREITLAVAPRQCWTIAAVTNGRPAWGLAVQLYGLRRAGDGGIGDFTALETMVRRAGAVGAAAVAISPVHAQFSADPGRFSPYSPSSRQMFNGLHADPGPAFMPGEPPPPVDGLLDWPVSAAWRLAAFRRAFAATMAGADGKQQAGSGPGLADFQEFRRIGGDNLERHARFEALHAARLGVDPNDWDWHGWPAEWRDPDSHAVAQFAARHSEEVTFHAYLQFLADVGMKGAQQAAREAGMSIGLISDIAVGVCPGGSDVWSRQSEMLDGLTIGAPGDLYNPKGQDWGVTSFSPHGLAVHGYACFLEMLRASLRHAGGVRLDHVMGLARLWVVPKGAPASDGAYLRFPYDDILRLVKLESWRHRAIVLGEDLGTLPEGFRERLQVDGLAGMRVLWFERDDHRFLPPQTWSPTAVAMTSTHDLPTVAGWWSGRDQEWRRQLNMEIAVADDTARDHDRAALWRAFQESGAAQGPMPATWDTWPVVDAACVHIGKSACGLTLLPLEDALALPEQPNLPGTMDEHPNWRRRLGAPVGTMLSDPPVAARLQALDRSRA